MHRFFARSAESLALRQPMTLIGRAFLASLTAIAIVVLCQLVSVPASVHAQEHAPVRVGGNVQAPRKIKDVRPDYPTYAQTARVQGVVILEIIVGPTGRVQDA